MSVKKSFFAVIIAALLALAACTTTDFSSNAAGASDYATVVVKDFVTLGIVTVQSDEIHHSGPFGFVKRVEGSKITYADLMQEAAKLEADDIINVRIDVHYNYRKTAFDWLIGWTRVYTHTGTALAIKYTDKLESKGPDSRLYSIPGAPEASRAVKTTKTGQTQLK